MANPEHLAILRQGVEQWNKWREEHPDVRPDLGEANLSEADLRQTNLSQADLRRTNLRRTNLTKAQLSGANLNRANVRGANLSAASLRGAVIHRADLSGAKLNEVDLYRTDLSGADFSGADLGGAHLYGANLYNAELRGADFSAARAEGTNFAYVDLSTAKSLETVRHDGPSTIGIDTIYKSRGKIPEVFLRGCGVPDAFIAYIGSMVGWPIEYYSCFISYSTRDQKFAARLHADLQAKGVRCWFAPHDMHGGRNIHEQIDEAIRLHDRLLLILSEDSMKSDWVRIEIAKARKREKEDKRVLFPVRLVTYEAMQSWEYIDSSGKDLAEEIRQYFIPDFSRWKEHDSYQAALGRLVKDLKAVASGQ